MGRLMCPRIHATAPSVGDGRSAPTPPFLGLHVCNKMDLWPMDGPILLHTRSCLIPRKKIAWEGDTQVDRQILRLLDRIGPVGRFDEKPIQLLTEHAVN